MIERSGRQNLTGLQFSEISLEDPKPALFNGKTFGKCRQITQNLKRKAFCFFPIPQRIAFDNDREGVKAANSIYLF
jgi:hypothetical protein